MNSTVSLPPLVFLALFKAETASFPFITVYTYSGVLIRNLVDYESMIKSEADPMILNWYVQLMNGLIHTVESFRIVSISESMTYEEVR